MGRIWVASLGEEVLYEEDMPGCCRHSARSAGGHGLDEDFGCPVCGAEWRAASLLVEPEECAFTERPSDRERKGAA